MFSSSIFSVRQGNLALEHRPTHETSATMAGMLKALGLCILLISAAISLQGCGCDKDAAKKCAADQAAAEVDLANMCAGVQTGIDCIKDCCEEKASDVTADCTGCGEKTMKEMLAPTMAMVKALCPDVTDPCA